MWGKNERYLIMINAQMNFMEEMIIDNFAGGGGASTGKKLTSLEERGFTFEECEAMKAGFKTCEGCNRENAVEMIRR